jgi:hypothetical protein
VLRDAISEGKTRGLSGWKGFTTARASTKPDVHKTFFGKVTVGANSYIGTWSPYVREGSVALRRLVSMRYAKKRNGRTIDEMEQAYGGKKSSPREQVAARINHEIRGRPYLKPSAQELLSNGRLNFIAERGFQFYVENYFKFRNESV